MNVKPEELIAHRGDMMLLHRLLSFDEFAMTAEVIVRNDGLFGDADTVPAWLGVEYMAQTIAAHGGMMDKIANRPSQIGFLLGTRRYTSHLAYFTVGSVLTVHVQRLIEDQGLSVFACRIESTEVLAEANLNVYQPNSENNRVLTV